MTAKSYDEKCYDLAGLFLQDEPDLFTLHHNHHLACAIQTAIEEYIADAKRSYEPPSPPTRTARICGVLPHR